VHDMVEPPRHRAGFRLSLYFTDENAVGTSN
jgi:hypothetical protein